MSYTSPRPDQSSADSTLQRWVSAGVSFVADNLAPLIIGGLIGLALGLFIGWVVWPVNYEGTVAITDLDEQTQANYIAAVAESYVYHGTSQALAVAEQRLAPYGDDVGQALLQAYTYFGQSGDPNATIYQNNVRQLASDLGAEQVAAAAEAAATQAVEPATDAAESEVQTTGGRAWLWWLVTLLGVALLVYVVVAVIRWWQSRAARESVGTVEVLDKDAYVEPAAAATPVETPPAISPQPPARGFVDAEGYEFSDETEEELDRQRAARTVGQVEDVEEDEFDAEPEEEASAQPAVAPPPETPRQPKKLGEFTAQYRIGMRDYEESQNIRAGTGPYIGEYGMGVNMKNGILQNNPEHVIALDIWLFDKVDPTRLASQTRVLLAEQVFDSGMEDAFPRENPGDPEPIIAEEGQHFELHGNKLMLDCRVIKADYVESGPAKGVFADVKVDLAVYSVADVD